MTVQRTIRNFPEPYPDECLYSLFSRYHARSGNATFRDTAEDLFGNPMFAFHSSVTTPYRLEFVHRWYPQDAETFAKKLLFYHTGFQYYCLICWPSRRKEYYEAFCLDTAKNFKPAVHMAREISCDFHYLRYCPMCAGEELERYGEPYWSILHQIDGVDFCPVHGCRLCDSSVSKDDTRKQLKPASQILTKRDLAQTPPVFATTELDQECLAFSEDVWWLLNHGASLDPDMIEQHIFLNRPASYINKYYRLLNATKYLVTRHASAAFQQKMESLFRAKSVFTRQNPINQFAFYTYFLPIRVLTIHYLSGSAENFGRTMLNDTTNTDC